MCFKSLSLGILFHKSRPKAILLLLPRKPLKTASQQGGRRLRARSEPVATGFTSLSKSLRENRTFLLYHECHCVCCILIFIWPFNNYTPRMIDCYLFLFPLPTLCVFSIISLLFSSLYSSEMSQDLHKKTKTKFIISLVRSKFNLPSFCENTFFVFISLPEWAIFILINIDHIDILYKQYKKQYLYTSFIFCECCLFLFYPCPGNYFFLIICPLRTKLDLSPSLWT